MNSEQKDTSLTVMELFLVIRKNYLFIFLVAILGFVISASYSLMVTPIYASTALIATNSSDDQGSNSLSSSISGLPGLSGLLSTSGSVSRSEFAYQKLISKEFFKILYMDDKFIAEFFDSKPHFQKGYEDFHRIHFIVSFNRKSGLTNLILKNKSAEVAAKSLNRIIVEVNDYVKEEEKQEAEDSLAYLKLRLSETSIIEVQKVIAALIQQTLQKLMLTEVTDEYLFEVIDEPFVPNYRFSPKRTQLTIIGTVSFGLFALIIAIFSFTVNGKTAIDSLRAIRFTKKAE